MRLTPEPRPVSRGMSPFPPAGTQQGDWMTNFSPVPAWAFPGRHSPSVGPGGEEYGYLPTPPRRDGFPAPAAAMARQRSGPIRRPHSRQSLLSSQLLQSSPAPGIPGSVPQSVASPPDPFGSYISVSASPAAQLSPSIRLPPLVHSIPAMPTFGFDGQGQLVSDHGDRARSGVISPSLFLSPILPQPSPQMGSPAPFLPQQQQRRYGGGYRR